MSEKELKMFDVDAQLDAVFGKEGTPERKAAEDRANAFFTGQIIEEARKKAKMTQEELAKKIVADIKESKIKVQASIQGDQVRVSGKDKDDLQAVIKILRSNEEKYDYPLQFTNYR